VELEYILTHRGGRGQSFLYELLYTGEGGDGSKFLMGLIDPDKLTYNNNWDIKNPDWYTPGTPQVQRWDIGGSPQQHGSTSSKQADLEGIPTNNLEKHALAAC
jgi:hypothetical protein